MFTNTPFGLEDDPEAIAIAEASAKLKDTIDFVPNGHEDLKPYFLDISMTLVFSMARMGGSTEGIVDVLNHVEKIVRDVYSRLEVRL
ncbi:hypothetical protein AB0C87_25145 [Actinomadura sp. NPDC048021]|uniref:hypothetical protein n=1 Tax=Actinomadura sp. NPDC048021 TaxID=3155385 RepID=UPI003405DB81